MHPAHGSARVHAIIAAYYDGMNASHPHNGGLWQFDATLGAISIPSKSAVFWSFFRNDR
jgi:hypothetical protein